MVRMSSIAGAHLRRAPTTKLDHNVIAVRTVSHTATMSEIAKASRPGTSNQPHQDLPTTMLFPRVPLQQPLPRWLPHPLNIRFKQLCPTMNPPIPTLTVPSKFLPNGTDFRLSLLYLMRPLLYTHLAPLSLALHSCCHNT